MLSELLIKKQDQKFVCLHTYLAKISAHSSGLAPDKQGHSVKEEKGNCFHWAFFKACGRNRAAIWLPENTIQVPSTMLCDV